MRILVLLFSLIVASSSMAAEQTVAQTIESINEILSKSDTSARADLDDGIFSKHELRLINECTVEFKQTYYFRTDDEYYDLENKFTIGLEKYDLHFYEKHIGDRDVISIIDRKNAKSILAIDTVSNNSFNDPPKRTEELKDAVILIIKVQETDKEKMGVALKQLSETCFEKYSDKI